MPPWGSPAGRDFGPPVRISAPWSEFPAPWSEYPSSGRDIRLLVGISAPWPSRNTRLLVGISVFWSEYPSRPPSGRLSRPTERRATPGERPLRANGRRGERPPLDKSRGRPSGPPSERPSGRAKGRPGERSRPAGHRSRPTGRRAPPGERPLGRTAPGAKGPLGRFPGHPGQTAPRANGLRSALSGARATGTVSL